MRRLLCLILSLTLSLMPCLMHVALAEEPTPVAEEDADVEVSAADLSADDAAVGAISADFTLTTDDKLAAVFERYQTMGACVCVIENGEITYTYCYGERDKLGTPVTEDTAFRIGSISKMVTAMGVMQLAESGKIAPDGDLGDALGVPVRHPQYPNTPVTLRQLMSHTAGLRDSGYYTLALRGDVRPLSTLFSGERLQYVFYADSEAGFKSVYSNFGGGLLGCIIESLSGQTLDQYMSEHVFAPLGINAAYQAELLDESVPVSDMYSMPHRTLTATVRGTATPYTQPDPLRHYTLSAGKLTLSAPDLAKLVIALCDGGVCGDARVLTEASAAELRTPQNYRGSVVCQSNRGLCMNLVTDSIVDGRTLYGHGGKANGMLCAAYFDPTDRTGVVMLTNGCNNSPMYQGVGVLSRAVIRLCYAELIDGRHVTEDPWAVRE